MRVRTVAFPFLGAAGGALVGGAFGLLVGGLWALAGAPAGRAFALASWILFAGTGAGAIMGVCRALDRWLTEPGTEDDAVRQDVGSSYSFSDGPVRVFRILVEQPRAGGRPSGPGAELPEGGTTFPVSDRRNEGRPPSRP